MLNKVIIMGRLTRDPELRHTQSNTAVCSFSLACNRDFVAQGGQQTDFFDVVAWGRTGEFASKYFVKGQLVAVTGRLEQRSWEDRNGNKRISIEINASECHFAESKRSADEYSSRQTAPKPASFDLDDDEYSDISDEDGDLPF